MGTFVCNTSLQDFAPPPPWASPCTERNSYLLVSWLPASCSTRFKVSRFQLFHIPPPRWQSSTVLCRSLVCTTALLEPELSVQAVSSVHTIASNQSLFASPINKVGLITKKVHHYYLRRSYSTKGLYGKETKEKYIFVKKMKTNFFQQASPSPMTPEHFVVVGAVVVVVVGKMRPKSPSRSPGRGGGVVPSIPNPRGPPAFICVRL